jgi:hypothetical protein
VLEDCSSEQVVVSCVVLLWAGVIALLIQHLQVPPIQPQAHPARIVGQSELYSKMTLTSN